MFVVVEEPARPGAILGYAYDPMEGRTRGVGAALVQALARELEQMGAPRIVLHTATQNAPAQRLFEELGFRRTMVEMTRERD